jgi:hypothetical protein
MYRQSYFVYPLKMEVMVNREWGRFFSFSEVALYQYCIEKNIEESEMDIEIERNDPVMIGIVKRMGADAEGPNTKIYIEVIDERYRDFYGIDYFDGFEVICIDHMSYQISKIKQVMENNENFDPNTIVDKIKQILNETFDKKNDSFLVH